MSSVHEVHCSLQPSATPNMAYTDNPVYWNKYERLAAGLPEDVSHLTETCLSCSEKFVPEVAGQSFCSEECYVPPCSICQHDLGLLPGDNAMVFGLHLCASCYWDADWEWKHRHARACHTSSEEDEEEDDNRPCFVDPADEEADDLADHPPTKKEILETHGAPYGRHYKTYKHCKSSESSSSNAAGASSTPPPSPALASSEEPEVRYIFPGEPDYNGYNHELDDWEEDEEEEEEMMFVYNHHTKCHHLVPARTHAYCFDNFDDEDYRAELDSFRHHPDRWFAD